MVACIEVAYNRGGFLQQDVHAFQPLTHPGFFLTFFTDFVRFLSISVRDCLVRKGESEEAFTRILHLQLKKLVHLMWEPREMVDNVAV